MAEEDENWRSDEHQHSHGFREQNFRHSSPKVAPCRKKLKCTFSFKIIVVHNFPSFQLPKKLIKTEVLYQNNKEDVVLNYLF